MVFFPEAGVGLWSFNFFSPAGITWWSFLFFFYLRIGRFLEIFLVLVSAKGRCTKYQEKISEKDQEKISKSKKNQERIRKR